MSKFKIFFFFLFSIIVLNCAGAFAALPFTVSYTEDLEVVIPRGSDDAPIGTMQLTATADNITVESITIENTGAVGFGSAEVSKVMMRYGDVEITELDPGGSTHTFSLDNPIAFDTGEQESFEFFYSVSDKATIGATVNFEIITVSGLDGGSGDSLSPVGTFGSAKVSGVEVSINATYTPLVVLPGAEKEIVAYFSVTPREEDLAGDDFSMIIDSGSGDDVTPFDTTNSDMGITKVYVYEDKGVIGVFEDDGTDVKMIEESSFTNARSFTYQADFDQFDEGVSRNFWVLYDIGSNTHIGEGNEVQFLISDLSSRGRDSGLQVPMEGTLPKSVPLEIDLAGLKLETVAPVLSAGEIIGPGEQNVPVARFWLAAHELAVSVSELTIVNSGNIPFVNNIGDQDGITHIEIYKDVDRDDEFEGNEEKLVAQWALGQLNAYGNPNTSQEVVITGLDEFIPTTNYDENNPSNMTATLQKYFVLYSIGDAFDEKITSLDSVEVNVSAGRATSNATDNDILLSGINPDYNVEVSMDETNVLINDITSLVPSFSIQSAINVPILSYVMKTTRMLRSVQVELESEGGAYYNDTSGITSVRLYRESNYSESGNDTSSFGNDDILEGEIKQFSDDIILKLPEVDIEANTEEKYYVIVDLSKECKTDLEFQINDVYSSLDTIVLSDIYPRPDIPINLNVTANNVALISISSTVSVMAVSTDNYTVDVVISNANSYHITLNSVDLGFYENSISGKDRSSEFIYSPSSSIPLAPSTVTTVSFTVSPGNVRTSTRFIIDPICSYSTTLSASSIVYLGRYKTEAGYQSLLGSNYEQWNVNAPESGHYEYPSHVSAVTVNGKPFYDDSIIAADTNIEIQFADNGKSIKASSIEVMLNERMLDNIITMNYYVYEEEAGLLTVQLSNNSNSGYLLVRCSDMADNMYSDLHLNFMLETSATALSISGLMTYPTPFRPGNGNMQVDFSITAAANVEFYIYNHIGRKVWQSQYVYAVYGDYTEYFDGRDDSGNYLPSGVYVLYALATSSSGDDVVAKTVFAIK